MFDKSCNKIKDLEVRLACLQEKYEELKRQLEDERNNSSSDEGMLYYQSLLEEKRIIEKYIDKIADRLSHEEMSPVGESRSETVSVGSTIFLVNDVHSLKFKLVLKAFVKDASQISVESPIGRAILGKKVGDKITVKTPKGSTTYIIKSAY
jgi:transcription elongation factor GreA